MFFTRLCLIALLLVSTTSNAHTEDLIAVQCATLENIRGKNGARAYANQDRFFVDTENERACISIFDGHGPKTGGVIAGFVSAYLPQKILASKSLRLEALAACVWMQQKIKAERNNEGKEGGTTALMGFIQNNKLLIANIGDSRAIGILKGKVTQLSYDHKPSHEAEKKRVLDAGGFFYNGYVIDKNGTGLALTRSLGDLAAHEGGVIIATPEITEFRVQKGDTLIFASDGLWDVMTNTEVVAFIQNHTVEELVKEARKRGSRDDITAVVAIIK